MFKNAKIGDKLYSIEEGWGVLEDIIDSDYPLIVQFKFQRISFTIDGKRWRLSKNPTLFWDEIKFEIPKKPLPDIKVDTPVLVWDEKGGKKKIRHFRKFTKKGKMVCFAGGVASQTNKCTHEWNYWELVEDNTKDKK